MATKRPGDRTVPKAGVRKRGCTRAKAAGSSPSRAMAMKMRDCPS